MRSGGYFMDIAPPDAPMIGPPRSILYLAGAVKDMNNVETDFLDILANPDLKHIRDKNTKPPVYFGMKDSEIIDYVKSYSPGCIAITCTANYFAKDTIKIINLIHRNFPDIIILIGGPDATNDYQMYLEKAPGINAVIMKEGEETFREIIDSLINSKQIFNIRGIAYKNNGKIKINPQRPYIDDLDRYKCDYEVLDLEKYFNINKEGFPSRLIFKSQGSHRSIDIVTSRGCQMNCSFCCIHLHMGKKVRAHSVQYVLDEMELLITKYNVKNFHFEDDNLLFDPKRFKDILRGIKKKRWNITWDTPNGVRADLVDEEFLQLCRDTQCAYLIFGIESGSKKVLDKIIKKDIDLKDIERACKLCYNYEIDTLGFFIFGLPGETKQDLLKTYYFAFDLFKKYSTTPIFQLWRPYKNTEMETNIRETENISQPVIFSLHQNFEIPYSLFYSQVYEDDEITIEFLSYYFKKYIRDGAKYAFLNWVKISRRKPLIFAHTVIQIIIIFSKSILSPKRLKYRLQQYMVSPGILPFAQLHRIGRKRNSHHYLNWKR